MIAAMLASGAGSAFAWVPSERNDSKCIDIRNLGDEGIVALPTKQGKKVCGCKTCKVVAMTYDMMIPYVDSRINALSKIDGTIIKNIQYKINSNANEITALNIVLFTDSARAVITRFLPGFKAKAIGNGVLGLIIAIEGCFLIYFDHQRRKYEIQALEGENEIINTESALRYMKAGIEAKNYEGRNYYFVSMNNQYDMPDAIGTFAKKQGLTYPNPERFNEEYFNDVKEHIDVVLNKIESGDFNTHESFDPDKTKLNKNLDTLVKVAIPTVVLAEIFETLTLTKVVDLNYIKARLEEEVKNLSPDTAMKVAKIIKALYKGKFLKAFNKLGSMVYFYILGDKHDKTQKLEDSGETEPEVNIENNTSKSTTEKDIEELGKFDNLSKGKVKLDLPNVSLPKSAVVA